MRYTPEQLSKMATIAIEDRDAYGYRYQQLIHTLSQFCGYSLIVVDRHIEELIK